MTSKIDETIIPFHCVPGSKLIHHKLDKILKYYLSILPQEPFPIITARSNVYKMPKITMDIAERKQPQAPT